MLPANFEEITVEYIDKFNARKSMLQASMAMVKARAAGPPHVSRLESLLDTMPDRHDHYQELLHHRRQDFSRKIPKILSYHQRHLSNVIPFVKALPPQLTQLMSLLRNDFPMDTQTMAAECLPG